MNKKIGPVVLGLSLLLLCAPLGAAEVKDPEPPLGTPGPGPEATGGPDAFGYTFADGAEATCAAFTFIDISATGTVLGDGDDVSFAATLGAPFDFYGTSFTQLQMSSNGYISTDPTDTGPDLSNDCPLPVPPSTGGGARIYPLHDDLDLEAGIGQALYQFFPVCPRPSDRCEVDEPCSVLMWDDVAHFPGGVDAPTWDMQVILYHVTNDFVFLVGPGNPETGSGSTTGIQDFPPPTTGLTYACNTAATIPDDTRVCFFHPNPIPEECILPEPSVLEIPTLAPAGLAGLG
ncbi:MAG: hypothetical protein KJ058_15695, partial [Thermoanaerobaculia bacterium]|nr:hypothetical protein [Thermoanaerobaculia bacterium]